MRRAVPSVQFVLFVYGPIVLAIAALVQVVRENTVKTPPLSWWLLLISALLLFLGGAVTLTRVYFGWDPANQLSGPTDGADETRSLTSAETRLGQSRSDDFKAWTGVFIGISAVGLSLGVLTILLFTSGIFSEPVSQPAEVVGAYDPKVASSTLPSITLLERAGQFGDTFGWVNALFSSLAFVGILYTIYLQRTELQLQRDEMRQARLEAEKTANATASAAMMSGMSALWNHYNNAIAINRDNALHRRYIAIRMQLVEMMHKVLSASMSSNGQIFKSNQYILDKLVKSRHELYKLEGESRGKLNIDLGGVCEDLFSSSREIINELIGEIFFSASVRADRYDILTEIIYIAEKTPECIKNRSGYSFSQIEDYLRSITSTIMAMEFIYNKDVYGNKAGV